MPKHHDDPFDELLDSATALPNPGRTVANVFPSITNTPYKLAIIGEAPGSDEITSGIPFFGASGRELNKILDKAKILRDACFIGNICQHQPPGNKIAYFDWDGPEIQSGLATLKNDLNRYRPNLVWLLGGSALHAFKCGVDDTPAKRKTKEGPTFAFPNSIGDWRGSLFLSSLSSPLPGVKCLASFHPAAALRNYEYIPLILLDAVCKVQKESTFPELILPERRLLVNLTFDELIAEMRKISLEKPLLSVDIEGGVGTMSCLSLATSPSFSFIVPFTTANGNSFWQPHEEVLIWQCLSSILGDASIPKVLQNSLYDRFVLQFSYGITVRNVQDDTMLKHWELYSELEKSLGFQCSIYTNEPFYKSERKSDTQDTFFKYCCKDSATTFEISEKLSKWLHGRGLDHYKFNMSLLNPLLYMELRGILYNTPLAKQRLKEIKQQTYALSHELNVLSGHHFTTTDKTVLISLARDTMLYKDGSGKVKADYKGDYDLIMRILLGEGDLTKEHLGYIADVLGVGLNVKGKAFKQYIYETLKLPEQFNKGSLTTDNEALLVLTKKATNDRQKQSLDLAISIAELRTRSQMLEIHADSDGRVRCGYNIVGTETGRITCYTSPTGSGYNLQTIPDENSLRPEGHPLHQGMRDLFTADPGYYLFQCDLSGADGWTVGAHLCSLGEPTMLEDLRSKIKPAAAVAYMLRHGNNSLKGKSREEIKTLLQEIKKDDYDYFMCKCGIWGICYLMGVDRLADLIFTQSEGKLVLSRSDVKNFRDSVFARYHPDKWHRATQDKLSRQPYPPKLTSASGHTRMFFGRYNEILGEALANEPQENTTYATNLAVYNLWHDPENRIIDSSLLETMPSQRPQCRLKIEPLHQVHDALLGQFRIADTSWAINKIKSYFNNPLIIAGIPITIPFSGSYGTNWAFNKESKVGDI